jgi:hypothetical protein
MVTKTKYECFDNLFEYDTYLNKNIISNGLDLNIIKQTIEQMLSNTFDKRLVSTYYHAKPLNKDVLKRRTLYRKTYKEENIEEFDYETNTNLVSYIYENNSYIEIANTLYGYTLHHAISYNNPNKLTEHNFYLFDELIDIYMFLGKN